MLEIYCLGRASENSHTFCSNKIIHVFYAPAGIHEGAAFDMFNSGRDTSTTSWQWHLLRWHCIWKAGRCTRKLSPSTSAFTASSPSTDRLISWSTIGLARESSCSCATYVGRHFTHFIQAVCADFIPHSEWFNRNIAMRKVTSIRVNSIFQGSSCLRPPVHCHSI